MIKILVMGASWCQPCKQIAKTLPRLEQELDGIATLVKIDIEQQQELTEQYNVRSIPTFVILNNSVEVQRFVGVTPLSTLEQCVKNIHQENSSGRE